jgi:hypothetical protein
MYNISYIRRSTYKLQEPQHEQLGKGKKGVCYTPRYGCSPPDEQHVYTPVTPVTRKRKDTRPRAIVKLWR